MSTATLSLACDPATEAAYRESVFSGEFEATVCEAAMRTRYEFDRDRSIFQRRQTAKRTLGDIGRLEEEARALEHSAAHPPLELTDELTVGKIRSVIESIAPSLRIDTWEGFGAGCRLIPQEPQQRQARARSARDDVNFAKRDAEHFLGQTAAKPPAGMVATADHYKNENRRLEQIIAGRQQALSAESEIPAARDRIAALREGRLSIRDQGEWQRAGFTRPPSEWTQIERENLGLLQRAKQALAALLSLAKGKSQAQVEQDADLAALAELRKELADAEKELREWCLDPRNMAFD